jgi:hypothetical protein
LQNEGTELEGFPCLYQVNGKFIPGDELVKSSDISDREKFAIAIAFYRNYLRYTWTDALNAILGTVVILAGILLLAVIAGAVLLAVYGAPALLAIETLLLALGKVLAQIVILSFLASFLLSMAAFDALLRSAVDCYDMDLAAQAFAGLVTAFIDFLVSVGVTLVLVPATGFGYRQFVRPRIAPPKSPTPFIEPPWPSGRPPVPDRPVAEWPSARPRVTPPPSEPGTATTWVPRPWEITLAEEAGVELPVMRLPGIRLPDGSWSTAYYSPQYWADLWPGVPYPYEYFAQFFLMGGLEPPWYGRDWTPPTSLNPPPRPPY